jgi:uncharacterized protein
MTMVRNEFVGRGFGFPLRVDQAGSMALVSDQREIEEAIRIILATSPGERAMRPEFGCRIHEHVFAPVSVETAGVLEYEVRSALDRWEPRITVTDVDVRFDSIDRSIVYIDITYRIDDVNDSRNLVFPFYSIPTEGSTISSTMDAPAGAATATFAGGAQ